MDVSQEARSIANAPFVTGRCLETLSGSCVFVSTALLLAKCFWEVRKLTSSRVQLGAPRMASSPPCNKRRLGAPSCTWQVTPAWALPQKHDLCQSTIGNEQVFRDFV